MRVLFSLPSGWTAAKVIAVSIYLYGGPGTIPLYVLGNNGISVLYGPVGVSLTTVGVFNIITLPGVVVDGDFYIVVGPYPTGLLIGGITPSAGGHTYYGTLADWGNWQPEDLDYMIRAEVEQIVRPAAPVGGFMEPVNKLAVFAPYLESIRKVRLTT